MTIDDWPIELRLRDEGRRLDVAFESGVTYQLAAEYLRVSSPSAEVQGHGKGDRKLVDGKHAVRIVEAVPVGNYAVRLVFDDGHDTGLFTWRYLRELGSEHAVRWPAYLTELEAAGRGR